MYHKSCGSIAADYYMLCDMEKAWGIVLESLAAAGILITIFLICSLFFLICKIQDNSKRHMVSIYFFFLLGTLGIFGLTFAFIIKLNDRTRPTRFFLFGVIFALCFSCLLTHACNLNKLVRGRKPFSWLVLLLLIFSFALVQVVINIEYLVTMLVNQKDKFLNMSPEDTNKDFVMLLIYVLFLMALTFLVSMFTFCGSYKSWKRHGAHIFVTILFSIAIWVVWITMLTKGNTVLDKGSWDDPVVAIALVSNGWIFLIMYIVPEICYTLEILCSSSDLVPTIHLKMNPPSKKEARRSHFHQLRLPKSTDRRYDCASHGSATEVTFVPWSQTSRFVKE
uniref:G-protein coupled receptors family 3 profile domain-containing protein n=1 Tax=Strix occidentalis caurina TaxID=311401 RepID=A0A8D0ESX1_STROC